MSARNIRQQKNEKLSKAPYKGKNENKEHTKEKRKTK